MRRRAHRRRTRAGARWPARLALLAGGAIVALAAVAPPAGANYGRISARVGCDRMVSWTASASTEGDAAQRTNRRILVEHRSGGGEWIAAAPEGHFDAANDFSFSGSFPLPDGVDSVDLRVTPKANWGADGKGDAPGGPRFSRAELPEGCAEQPVVASVAEDCSNGGARITARNVGDRPAAVTVSADGVALRSLELAPDAADELVVPTLEDDPTQIRVAAGDFVISEATVPSDCGLAGPAAVVLERCASRTAVVLARLGDRPSGSLQVRVAGSIVHKGELVPTDVARRTLELPPTGSAHVEVSVADTVVASGDVGSCVGAVAGAATCGVEGRPECAPDPAAAPVTPAPPPPPPPTTIELDPADPLLPRTGPWERAIALLLGGALLLAGGAAVATRDRRRPLPSPVAAAIAPYRQRWWDDR